MRERATPELLAYFKTHLKVGLELELDFRSRELSGDELFQIFGVAGRAYHDPGPCPVCGRPNCWEHVPANLLRAIEHDGSIYGWEFIIYGNTLPTKEFIKKLEPLVKKLSEHFTTSERDSCHAHALLTDEIPHIPSSILRNIWQLFRYFFPGFSWLFGNQRETVYRRSGYAGFLGYNISGVGHERLGRERNGVYFGNITQHNFNVEIRMADATLNIKQIAALRAIVRAMVLRAVELAQIGVINVDTDQQKWEQYKNAGKAINKACQENVPITQDVKEIMKRNAQEMLNEIKHLLDNYELKLISELIANPPRESGEMVLTETTLPQLSPLARKINSLIINKAIIAQSEEEAIQELARITGKSEDKIQKALKELGATWEPSIHEFKVKA